MAIVRVHPHEVVIELSRLEKTLSFSRGELVIPRSQIQSAIITVEPWEWLRGVRSAGTINGRRFAYGTWRFTGGSDFVLLRGRRRRAVVLTLEPQSQDLGAEFSRILISTEHATALVRALKVHTAQSVQTFTVPAAQSSHTAGDAPV